MFQASARIGPAAGVATDGWCAAQRWPNGPLDPYAVPAPAVAKRRHLSALMPGLSVPGPVLFGSGPSRHRHHSSDGPALERERLAGMFTSLMAMDRCCTAGPGLLHLPGLAYGAPLGPSAPSAPSGRPPGQHEPANGQQRPFRCDYCGKAFKLRHHMKDHCRVHTGERPFPCHLCGKTFSRSTILKAHEKTHLPKAERLLHHQQPGQPHRPGQPPV